MFVFTSAVPLCHPEHVHGLCLHPVLSTDGVWSSTQTRAPQRLLLDELSKAMLNLDAGDQVT